MSATQGVQSPEAAAPYTADQLSTFDIDAYLSEYTGRACITRLCAIPRSLSSAGTIPKDAFSHPTIVNLKRQALLRVIPIIKAETLDVTLYGQVLAELGNLNGLAGDGNVVSGDSSGTNRVAADDATEKMDLDPVAPAAVSSSFSGPSSLSRHVSSALPSSSPSAPSSSSSDATKQEALGIPDEVWIRQTKSKAQKEKDKLDVEMRNYTVNLIKESIRLAHHAVATHQRRTGDAQGAVKSYSRAREFNSNAVHELESSMGIVEVSLDERAFYQSNPAIIKAEYAINRISTNIKPTNMGPGISANQATMGGTSAASQHVMTGAQERANVEKQKEADENQQKTTIRLRVARGLGLLSQGGTGAWESAAREFAGITGKLEEWEGKVISPSDIAIYTALTALATMSRSAIRTNILENSYMRSFIDYGNGAFVKELVLSFVEAKYDVMLAVLTKNKLRLDIDPNLNQQVQKLVHAITHRAYLQYFEPFQNVQLTRMAQAFGYTQSSQVVQLAEDLKWLIEKGRLDARLDAIDNVLYAVKIDHRKKLFAKAIGTGNYIEASTQKTMIRLKFLEAKLFVETRKEREERLSKQGKKQQAPASSLGGGGGDYEMQAALAASLREH